MARYEDARTYTYIQAHLPDSWLGDVAGDGEPDHEVAKEVEDGAEG